jgi:hypothetical protein
LLPTLLADFKDDTFRTGAYFKELVVRLAQLHDVAYEHSLKVNEKARAKANARYARRPMDRLNLGEYVMMHTQRDQSARKYLPNWTGPHQVVEVATMHAQLQRLSCRYLHAHCAFS